MRRLVTLAVIVVCGALVQSADDKPVVRTATELEWTDNTAIKGAQQAVLWGDPSKESYGALKKVPAGAVLPPHTHSSLTRFVVLGGTLSFSLGSAPARVLGPQAYGSIPGGVRHSATCQAGADCVYFETSPAAYDFRPAVPAK